MSVNKIFTPCPMPAAEDSVFCKNHADEITRLELQAGRKMIVLPWEGQIHSLIVRGFLNSYKRLKFNGGNFDYNRRISNEWDQDREIILRGMDMLDRQDQFWAENSKTGN